MSVGERYIRLRIEIQVDNQKWIENISADLKERNMDTRAYSRITYSLSKMTRNMYAYNWSYITTVTGLTSLVKFSSVRVK